jgi:hypothetical protein
MDNPEKLETLGKTYTGRYLNTNENMDNPEKLETLGKTYTGRYLNTNQSKHGQSRETNNIG